jgi:AMP-binding enzyme C-terminal domain
VPDPEWGERVAVAVVLNDGHALDLPSLRAWSKEFLAPYKLPSRLLELDALPRNAMGKVMKPAVRGSFKPRAASPKKRLPCTLTSLAMLPPTTADFCAARASACGSDHFRVSKFLSPYPNFGS